MWNDDSSALRCISLNFELIQNFVVFAILMMPMRILLAFARIQRFKKYCKKQLDLTEDSHCFRKKESASHPSVLNWSGQWYKLLADELAAGGEPSTWSPPGRLVERDFNAESFQNNSKWFPEAFYKHSLLILNTL